MRAMIKLSISPFLDGGFPNHWKSKKVAALHHETQQACQLADVRRYLEYVLSLPAVELNIPVLSSVM